MFNKLKKRVQPKASKEDRKNVKSVLIWPSSKVVIKHESTAGAGADAPNSGKEQLSEVPSPSDVNEPNRNLPMLKDVPASERQDLFNLKVQIGYIQFDSDDPSKMDQKKLALTELVDYVKSSGEITESNQEEMVKMISSNIFRCLPPAFHENTGREDIEPDEDELYRDPSWVHLQIAYDLLLHYVVSTETHSRIAKRFITHLFVLKLVGNFDSEDSRERVFLKTILHRIYGKFMVHRPLIRKAITNVFYRFIHETQRQNGVTEFLEIIASIVNGFTLPIKEEHKLFLVRALIPLHKLKSFKLYHKPLSYCILQFVEKDCKLADTVIKGLLKYWPVSNCQKEIIFLGELEDVLLATQASEFECCMVPLFKQIARCINSPHFQVAERALWLWSKEPIVALVEPNRKVIFPIVFEAIEKNGSHWNPGVQELTGYVRKMLLDMDMELFEECRRQYEEKNDMAEEIEVRRRLSWLRLAEAGADGKVNEPQPPTATGDNKHTWEG